MAKKYYSMNEVPPGTKMIVKDTEEEVTLIEVQNFPTIFITENSDKIKKILGFDSEFTIKNAVNDLRIAFKKNLLPNSLTDEKYFNIRRMQSIKLS